MIILSDKSFELFKKLPSEYKKELEPVFKMVSLELKQILEWYRDNPDLLEKDLFDEEEVGNTGC